MSEKAPRTADFKRELEAVFATETRLGRNHIVLRSGDFHRSLGVYPNPGHAMPTCCNVMRAAMKPGDQILRSPPKGQGANLVVRFMLPR